MRFYLLSPGDHHLAGDEIFDCSTNAWKPLNPMHIGTKVSRHCHPCRRELSRHQILKLTIEAGMATVAAMTAEPEF